MPSIFVACAPGLESLLAGEIEALGLGRPQITAGGAVVRGGRETLYRANLELGLALRVLVRLGHFEARHFGQLEDGARRLPWADWLAGVGDIKVTTHRSRLYHSGAIAERIGRIAGAGLPAGATNQPTIVVRLARDRCTVSIDTSGPLLTRRGYRLATAKAPLRTDLARALVLLSEWDRKAPLVDPLCGAGTILIEAALLARRRPPGQGREFAFQHAPSFDASLWRRVLEQAQARQRDGRVELIGSDRDGGAVEAARANAERAGVAVRLARAALSASPCWSEESSTGALCSNLPYGRRVSAGRDLRPLYQILADKLAQRPRWRIGIVAADPGLVTRCGIRASTRVWTDHGGARVALMAGEVADGGAPSAAGTE